MIPVERHVHRSSGVIVWLFGSLLVGGTGLIIANYLNWLPGEPSNARLGIGLLSVLAALLVATRWR